MTKSKPEPLDLSFGSELPTQPDLERAALAAYVTAKSLGARQPKKPELTELTEDDPLWCDSEAPTGVEAERPVFPQAPRTPRV